MAAYEELRFPSADKRLTLYARVYEGTGPTILMMHGLTRNSSDFEGLAEKLAGHFKLIVPDQRGRGCSDYDDQPENYQPANYSLDMLGLIDLLALDHPILLGTSMGGLMAMIMATMRPSAFRGIILNDVGPEVDPAGLRRIASYVGAAEPIHNWQDAAEYCKRTNGYAFPSYGDEDWQAFAHRLFRSGPDGTPELAYDPAIAAGLSPENQSAVPPDLWPMWQGLKSTPILAVRGALSDILSPETLVKMEQTHPQCQSVIVPGVGHAPMLIEAEAVAAIRRFLGDITKDDQK